MTNNIFQEIWNADQDENGLEAILSTDTGDMERGFVKVNANMAQSDDPDLKVITEVHIPEKKRQTYDLVTKLYNNYSLPEPNEEHDTPQERTEVHNFMSAIIKTAPMRVAQNYVARQTNEPVSDERWYNTVMELWFRRFAMGGDPALSGFEHVIVGEQQDTVAQGYHFWHKYFLDDGLGRISDGDVTGVGHLKSDRIVYKGSKLSGVQKLFPESVTMSFMWHAPDYEADPIALRPLFKSIGGFFVGCSVEGLMALGTICAHRGISAPRQAIIEGATYDMKLYASANGRHIRTFYPIFKGASDLVNNRNDVQVPEDDSSFAAPVTDEKGVRIIAALINPEGHDPGHETVTLINTTPSDINVSDWSLQDANGTTAPLGKEVLSGGEFLTIQLSQNTVQLSNKGGNITLLNGAGKAVHTVTYSKAQAREQGLTVIFA